MTPHPMDAEDALSRLNQLFRPFTRAERTTDGAYEVSAWDAEGDITAGDGPAKARSMISFEDAIEKLTQLVPGRLRPLFENFKG
jgi:hypothetical protein